MDDKKRITIALDAQLHDLGKKIAAADHRDFSGELAYLIEQEWKRREVKTEGEAISNQAAQAA